MFTIEPPRALDQAERVFAAEKGAVEIDRHGARGNRVVGILDGSHFGDAGGVDQAVEPARATLDRRDDALPVGLRGHVERMVDAFAPLEIGVDRDTAVAYDRLGHRRADRARSAGDEDDLVAQSAHVWLP